VQASEKKVNPPREETHGTDPSPLSLSFSLLDPPDAKKYQGGEEGVREEEAEISSPFQILAQ
jgi:hypothetical protein